MFISVVGEELAEKVGMSRGVNEATFPVTWSAYEDIPLPACGVLNPPKGLYDFFGCSFLDEISGIMLVMLSVVEDWISLALLESILSTKVLIPVPAAGVFSFQPPNGLYDNFRPSCWVVLASPTAGGA
jgi:hypothetical protein